MHKIKHLFEIANLEKLPCHFANLTKPKFCLQPFGKARPARWAMHHLPLRSLPGVSKVAKASIQHSILRSRIFKTLLQTFLHGDSKLLSTGNENRRSACVNQIFTCLIARLRNRDWAPLKPHQHAIPAQAKTACSEILQDGNLFVNDALHHKLRC